MVNERFMFLNAKYIIKKAYAKFMPRRSTCKVRARREDSKKRSKKQRSKLDSGICGVMMSVGGWQFCSTEIPGENTMPQDGTPGTKERRKPYTWLQAGMDYLTHGIKAVEQHLVVHSDAVGLLTDLINDLEEREQNASELINLRAIFSAAKNNGTKGRKPVAIGDTRDYKAQQTDLEGKSGEAFIKLPVALLGLSKGDMTRVFFESGTIKVIKRPENASPIDSDSDSDE